MYGAEPALQMGQIAPASCRVFMQVSVMICQELPVTRLNTEHRFRSVMLNLETLSFMLKKDMYIMYPCILVTDRLYRLIAQKPVLSPAILVRIPYGQQKYYNYKAAENLLPFSKTGVQICQILKSICR